MTKAWAITADWEALDEGDVAERSCFGSIGIQANGVWLTEGHDLLADRLGHAPLVSAYQLAEWFAWNWWRLRWEPRAASNEWCMAHKLSSIGGGYVWPNISIFSDGERTALISRATRERAQTSFRYINDSVAVILSTEFESVVDGFIELVLSRLASADVKDTNLARLWADVLAERSDPALSQARKLEALLGYDPDELSPALIDKLISDSSSGDMSAIEELAADSGHMRTAIVPSISDLCAVSKQYGFDTSPSAMVALDEIYKHPAKQGLPAWQFGANAARALRQQQKLGDGPISDSSLTTLLAVAKNVLGKDEATSPTCNMSFALDSADRGSRIVLRSRWREGRRFELARILGDRLMNSARARLYPATRAFTYRQKAQRSFAAEFLSPFESTLGMLKGDYSLENQLDVAAHFEVSEMTIRAQLVDHKILEREDLEPDLSASGAQC
jgi:hypothetical protein